MRRLGLLTLGGMLPCLIAGALYGQQAGQEAPRLKGPAPFTRETHAPPMQRQITDDVRRRRSYPDQSPLIPHAIEGYALDLNANKCLSCHSRKFTEQSQAPMISVTHYQDRTELPGWRRAPALCLSGLPRAANDGDPGPPRPTAGTKPISDVAGHREVAEEGVVLKHEPNLALLHWDAGGILLTEEHVPSVRDLKPGDNPQQRCFADPDGPSSARSSPARTSSDTPRSAASRRTLLRSRGHGCPCLSHAQWADRPENASPYRHSRSDLAARVTMARRARSEATAKAATKLYSL